MLDLYGWESVFYVSGILSVLWAYCMWKYLLKGEGKYSYRAFGSDEWQKRKVVLHHHDQSVATNRALPTRCFHIISLLFCCGILFCVRSKHTHLQSHCVRQRPLPRPRSLHSGAASRLFVSSCVAAPCLTSSVSAGPIITLESLGSSGTPSKLSKRHWLRLLKQPAVW